MRRIQRRTEAEGCRDRRTQPAQKVAGRRNLDGQAHKESGWAREEGSGAEPVTLLVVRGAQKRACGNPTGRTWAAYANRLKRGEHDTATRDRGLLPGAAGGSARHTVSKNTRTKPKRAQQKSVGGPGGGGGGWQQLRTGTDPGVDAAPTKTHTCIVKRLRTQRATPASQHSKNRNQQKRTSISSIVPCQSMHMHTRVPQRSTGVNEIAGGGTRARALWPMRRQKGRRHIVT